MIFGYHDYPCCVLINETELQPLTIDKTGLGVEQNKKYSFYVDDDTFHSTL